MSLARLNARNETKNGDPPALPREGLEREREREPLSLMVRSLVLERVNHCTHWLGLNDTVIIRVLLAYYTSVQASR